MSQLLITRSHSLFRGIQKRTLPQTFKIGTFFLLFIMTFLIGFMGFLYLMKNTDIHTKGYLLKRLENERNELKDIRERKFTNLSKVKSLNHIRTSEAVSRMVPMRNPIYIEEPNVAKN